MKAIQLPCPWCGQVVLSESLTVKRKRYRQSWCCWCTKEIEFVYTESDVECRILRLYRSGREPINLSNVTGVSLTTDSIVRIVDGMYEIRIGFAVMGSLNNEAAAWANPFDPNFHDNYVVAMGNTLEEATEKLQKEIDSIGGTLWA